MTMNNPQRKVLSNSYIEYDNGGVCIQFVESDGELYLESSAVYFGYPSVSSTTHIGSNSSHEVADFLISLGESLKRQGKHIKITNNSSGNP